MSTSSSSDRSSDDLKGAVYWNPQDKGVRSPVYSRDQEDLRKTILSTVSCRHFRDPVVFFMISMANWQPVEEEP